MSSPDVDLPMDLTAADFQAVLFRSLAEVLDDHPDLHPVTMSWAEHPENGWRRVAFQLPDVVTLNAWYHAMLATGPDVVVSDGREPMTEPGDPEPWDQVWFRVDGRLVGATEGTIQFWAPAR